MSKLDKVWYEDLFRGSQELTYNKGEIIIHPFDEPQGVYCITEGIVKVYSLSISGEERIHINYIAGEIFPLAWTVLGTETNIYHEALSDCCLLRLPIELFTERAKNDVGTAYTLFERAVSQYVTFVDRLYNMEYKYASERLVYRLLSLGRRMGKLQKDGTITIASMTQRDIAHSINLTPESLSREFDKLRRKGLVEKVGKAIVLLDVSGLEDQIKVGQPSDTLGTAPRVA